MSTNCPPVSKSPSMSRRLRPLSITCVIPTSRGFPGRAGTPRKPSLNSGIELLQLLPGPVLHLAVERAAVGVDSHDQRAEVLHTELPEALGHELLPGDLLDLLDLRRLERRGAADDGEVDHPEPLHRLDRLVGEAALAADRADAVLRAQPLGEAHHSRARRRADADLLVATGADLADVRRRVQEERAGEIDRRLHALVEDPDLGAVADPDDVPLHDHLVAGAQLLDLGGVGDRERDLVGRHQPPPSPAPPAPRGAEAALRAMSWPVRARTPPPRVGKPPAALDGDTTSAARRVLCRFVNISPTGGCAGRSAVMSRLPVVLDGAVRGDVRRRAPRRPALVVHRDRVQGHVRVGVLDVALEHGHVAAEPHWADARLVEELEELVLELRDERVGIARADRARDRLLREVHGVVGRAAEPDPDDPGWARLAARVDDRVEHEALDPGD